MCKARSGIQEWAKLDVRSEFWTGRGAEWVFVAVSEGAAHPNGAVQKKKNVLKWAGLAVEWGAGISLAKTED